MESKKHCHKRIETAFRPSYQGWKPGRRPEGRFGLCLLDLPIRDGNACIIAPVIPVNVLLDLPIRDGNSTQKNPSPSMRPPFRPSYQGWKLITSPHPRPYTVLLDLPIRDGNPMFNQSIPCHIRLLDLPIRDGNVSVNRC